MKASRCILLFVVLNQTKNGDAFLLPRRTKLSASTTFTFGGGVDDNLGKSKWKRRRNELTIGHRHDGAPLFLAMVNKKNSKNNDKYIADKLHIDIDRVEIQNASQQLRKMSIGHWEPYIIGTIVAFSAARSVLMKRRKEEDDMDQIEDMRMETKKLNGTSDQGIDDDRGEEKLDFSSPNLTSIFASFSTVLASLIIPFFDLDAALVVAECTPVRNMHMIRTLPSIKQIDMIDDAFDIEELLIESDAAESLDGSMTTTGGAANFGNVIFMTSSVVVTVLGTTLAKVRKTVHGEDWNH